MGFLIGLVSLASNYYWWNVDWWRPVRITNTAVGIEDFLIGFVSGGVIAVIYEELLKLKYARNHVRKHLPPASTILVLLALLTAWLFWVLKVTSFIASSIAMTVTAGVLLYFRKDLFWKSILTGILTVIVSLIFYYPIIFLVPEWVDQTYNFQYLSGTLVGGIPVEELIFWFFAGLVWGPFYEYWQGIRLVAIKSKK